LLGACGRFGSKKEAKPLENSCGQLCEVIGVAAIPGTRYWNIGMPFSSCSHRVGPKMATLTQKIADWVTKYGFERIALQFPDALLADAPEILQKVCFALKERRVFILGDSSSGGGGVDEVGALHYGADCIVRFGNAEQQRGGDLPVLFVFGDDDSSDAFCVGDADEVVRRVDGLFAKQGHSEADASRLAAECVSFLSYPITFVPMNFEI